MLKRRIKIFLYQLYRIAVRGTAPGLLIFESNLGRNYSGNPRAIYEEILRRGWDEELEICWIFTEPEKQSVPGKVKLLQREKLSALLKMHKAAIWVTDTRQPTYIVKNPNTYYMMTWHGTPLKKLALDLYDFVEAKTKKNAKTEADIEKAGEQIKDLNKQRRQWLKDSAQWDCLLAQNETAGELFRSCFWYQGEILCEGYPRNDKLVQEGERTDGKKRTILYAPTWREYESNGLCDSRFEPPIDFDKLYDVLREEDSELIIKYHYYVKEKPDFSKYAGVIRDSEKDIADLYPECDMLITDYYRRCLIMRFSNGLWCFLLTTKNATKKKTGFILIMRNLYPVPLSVPRRSCLRF